MKILFTRILKAYGQLVTKRPYVTQVVTAGVLVTAGDIVAQKIIENKKYDIRRTAVMATCGFMFFGPVVAVWLVNLNRWGFSSLVNVALDQGIAAPCILGGFFILQSLLMGKGWRVAERRLVNEFPSVLKVNYLVWLPAQIINFSVIPFQYRMLFIQMVAFFWNCYLSNRANRTPQESLESSIGAQQAE